MGALGRLIAPRPAMVVLLIVLMLAACGGRPEAPPAAPAQATVAARAEALLRGQKLGADDLGAGPIKLADDGAATPSAELGILVAALRGVLATRPGLYVQSAAQILDNATLAAQNSNPQYGQMLATWGRQTGYFAAFDREDADSEGRLLRASVILSRYQAAAGAHSAYAYVLQEQSRTARRIDLQLPPDMVAPWDEAVLFYQEAAGERYTFGQFTLVFRTSNLIGFITNVGLAGVVSTTDTADLTQAIIERIGTRQ